MTWDGSGVFVRLYNFVNDRDAAINILADRMDNEIDGIVGGINDIVDGTRDFKGPIRVASGTAALPGYAFADDTNSGIYRIGADNIGIAVAGALALDINGTRVQFLGNTLFHTGNDGAGSGLDADTVDGLQAAAFALVSHTHTIANVTGLQTALDGKAASSHTHVIADVTSLQSSLDGKANSSHTHAIADVTGLQSALDGKAASSHTHVAADITDLDVGIWEHVETVSADGTDFFMESSVDLSQYEAIRVTFFGIPDVPDWLKLQVKDSTGYYIGADQVYGGRHIWTGFDWANGSVPSEQASLAYLSISSDSLPLTNVNFEVSESTSHQGVSGSFIITNFGRSGYQKTLINCHISWQEDNTNVIWSTRGFSNQLAMTDSLDGLRLRWDDSATDWRTGSRMIIEGLNA